MTAIGTTIGGVPLVLIIALGIAVGLWWMITRTGLGRGSAPRAPTP